MNEATKVTAVAPSNIAFIKYWGAVDPEQALPENPSISMTLDQCVSRTTVEFVPDGHYRQVQLVGPGEELEPAPEAFVSGVERHLDALEAALDIAGSFRVATHNTFPSAAGIASSASGFAALAYAVAALAGERTDVGKLSILARLSGSGSAARSVLGGYVEWPSDAADPTSPARQLESPDHWALHDLIAIVSSAPKRVSSRQGHRLARTSPHFEERQALLPGRLAAVRRGLETRDLELLGSTTEEEAIELHLVAMSSRPPIFYWRPGTLEVLGAARALRRQGTGVWATMDAGANVHLVCESDDAKRVQEMLEDLPGVETVLHDRVGSGPYLSDQHLF